MKISIRLLSVAGIALLICASYLYAETDTYASIVAERDAVLSEMVALAESHYRLGTGGATEVGDAKIALYSFRRDASESVGPKIENQAQIVKEYERRVKELEVRNAAGIADRLSILKAKNALLAEKQLLESLKRGVSK